MSIRYQLDQTSDAQFLLTTAQSALEAADCPRPLAVELAPLVVPHLRAQTTEVPDPRELHATLPHRVAVVVDKDGKVRHHGTRNEPMTVRELVVELHNRSYVTRAMEAATDPRWLYFRWTPIDRDLH